MATQNLAIMFTDIKGFTERTSGSTRDGMKSLLAEHDRLLVPVFQYFDGRIVKTIGDAFLVTFGSPTDAVLCGVTIQEVLRQHNLAADEARRLEVRVAINVGEVELKDNDVLGEPVNIAARLEGVTEAGEVYFTDAVYQTMNRSEAPSADVGEKIFKGIPHAVRVYRVVHEPGSELATRLANGVRLSERGPVLAGIRDTIRRRRAQRNALLAAAVAVAVAVVVGGLLLVPDAAERARRDAEKQLADGRGAAALDTLAPALAANAGDTELAALALRAASAHLDALESRGEYAAARDWLAPRLDQQAALEALRPKLMDYQARAAVVEARTDPKQQAQYYPRAVKEFLERHAADPQAALAAERALGAEASAQTRTWLQREVLARGAAPAEDILHYQLGLQGDATDIDWELLDTSRELLQAYYPVQLAAWAAQALDGGNVLAFQNAWQVLEQSGDPRLQQPYYAALHSLVNVADLLTVDAARGPLLIEQDPTRRRQALAFLDELVQSFPRFLNSGDARDALARLRVELETHWGQSPD